MNLNEILHEALSVLPTLRETSRNVLITSILAELKFHGYTIVRDPTKPKPGPHTVLCG
jgi:hypothetical protein